MRFLLKPFKIFSKPAELVKEPVGPKKSIKEYLTILVDQLQEQITLHKEALKDLKNTNLNLALKHYSAGSFYDARFRFRLMKFFKADVPYLDYYIGRCYYEDGKGEKAKENLQKYLSSGDSQYEEEAKYTLKLIEGDVDTIEEVPNSINSHFRDLISPLQGVNDSQFSASGYIDKIFQALHKNIVKSGMPYGNNILDINCANGRLGVLCAENKVASSVIGLETSEKMIALASKVKNGSMPAYNEIHKLTFDKYVQGLNNDSEFDIIFSGGFLLTTSKYKNFLEQAFKISKKKSFLAFMAKIHDGKENHIFSARSEEFAFSKEYLLDISSKRWDLLNLDRVELMGGEKGVLIILQKK